MRDTQLRQRLAGRGVYFPNNTIVMDDDDIDQYKENWLVAADANPDLVARDLRETLDQVEVPMHMALDAQPGLFTVPSAGVPLFFTSMVDPQMVRVIFQPRKAAEIMGGEAMRGSWITQVDYFPIGESTGQVATYGDYSNNGAVDFNANWVPRQPYIWQAFKRMGEQQVARWGAAGIGYNAELDMGIVLKFSQFSNKAYFYGVTNLANYGLLNDPSLITAIVPYTKIATGTAWTNATAKEIYNDVVKLYGQLLLQMGNNIDRDATMTLALSPGRESLMATNTDFGITAREMVEKNFPNLTIKTAPEYTTGSGELMQMILPNFEGVQSALPAYTEKLRAHALITEPSAWAQKMSAGTWGTVIRRPIAIAQMLGI